MSKHKPYPGTQAVLRALSILKAFTDEHPNWGLTDLTEAVGLNKTTTYRLLTALESEEMVARNPHTDTYHLGPAIVTLGGCALRSNDLRSVCRPELKTGRHWARSGYPGSAGWSGNRHSRRSD